MSKEFNFEEQRLAANKSIRELKAHQPFIFPEWQRLQRAITASAEAHRELSAAQVAWDKLGENDGKAK